MNHDTSTNVRGTDSDLPEEAQRRFAEIEARPVLLDIDHLDKTFTSPTGQKSKRYATSTCRFISASSLRWLARRAAENQR